MANLCDCNLKETKNDKKGSNNKPPHEYQMIDSTLLNIGHQDEHRLELRSEVEDFRIYENNDDWIICIEVNMDPSNKDQLKT